MSDLKPMMVQVDGTVIPLSPGAYLLVYNGHYIPEQAIAYIAEWAARNGCDICFLETSDPQAIRFLRVEPAEKVAR